MSRGPWNWGRQELEGQSPVDDLGKYERIADGDDDYRHRMLMNVLAVMVTIVLMVVGGWLASTIAEMRKNQDCYLSGRRNCSPIELRQTE